MKTITKPVYYCEHCKKHGLSKHAMEHHEQFCNKNPINKRACYGCLNLKEEKIEHMAYEGYGGGWSIGFHCSILKLDLYPVVVERKGLPTKYPDTFVEQEPFKLNCEHAKYDLMIHFKTTNK